MDSNFRHQLNKRLKSCVWDHDFCTYMHLVPEKVSACKQTPNKIAFRF